MPLDNLIQRADLNQRITRALEIKGQKSPVLTLDNSVMAVVLAEDLTKQAEWTSPTERRLASRVQIAPPAGQTALLAIQNPAGSGVIGVVEKITATTIVTNQRVVFGLVNPLAIPAAPANMFFRDRRIAGAPTIRAWSGSDAALQIVNPYLEFAVSTSVATPWYETEGIVIQQGEAFGIQSLTVNIECVLTIWLQEIPI
jgi:hypothetical protein